MCKASETAWHKLGPDTSSSKVLPACAHAHLRCLRFKWIPLYRCNRKFWGAQDDRAKVTSKTKQILLIIIGYIARVQILLCSSDSIQPNIIKIRARALRQDDRAKITSKIKSNCYFDLRIWKKRTHAAPGRPSVRVWTTKTTWISPLS